jgi:hypothetical protein
MNLSHLKQLRIKKKEEESRRSKVEEARVGYNF